MRQYALSAPRASCGTSENSLYAQYETPLLQGFEAIGSLLGPLVAAGAYQAVLRQSIKKGRLARPPVAASSRAR